MIDKYNDFLLEKEFESIVFDIFKIVESNGIETGERTFEWDIEPKKDSTEEQPVTMEWDFPDKTETEDPSLLNKSFQRLKEFVSKLPKEKIKSYFIKFMNRLSLLPEKARRFMIAHYTSIFLAVASLGYLLSGQDSDETKTPIVKKIASTFDKGSKLDPKLLKEITELNRKSTFEEAQKGVKEVEAGFSDDRRDSGNWINIPKYGRRFVGTNHGISAPVLQKYLGKAPKKEDMENLSYETALEIFKKDYWDAQNLSEFCNQSVANIIYDGCVNQGIYRMKDLVKIAASEQGTKIDGETFTPSNIKKVNSLNQEKLFNSIKKQREIAYKNSDTWSIHGEGWMNRINNIQFSK